MRAHLLPRDEVLDRFDRALFGGKLDDIDTFGHVDDRRALLAPDPVAAEIQRDSVEPGREFRLALESRECPKCPEEGFLGDIPRVLIAADNPVRQGIDRPFPAQNQLVEAIYIALHGPGDELFVGRYHAISFAIRSRYCLRLRPRPESRRWRRRSSLKFAPCDLSGLPMG